MSFFTFHEPYDEDNKLNLTLGISTYIVVEAEDLQHAKNKLMNLGLKTDPCNCGHYDCNENYWYLLTNEQEQVGFEVPTINGKIVSADVNFPSVDQWDFDGWSVPRKQGEEGTPEGFIHYTSGEVVPFWQTTDERQDLDGSFGWGVSFNQYHVTVFMCTYNGWDLSGNNHAASAIERENDTLNMSWTKPDKPTIRFGSKGAKSGTHGHGNAWFPTEKEANEFAGEVAMIKAAVKKQITQLSKSYKSPYNSIVKMWMS